MGIKEIISTMARTFLLGAAIIWWHELSSVTDGYGWQIKQFVFVALLLAVIWWTDAVAKRRCD